MAPITQFTDWSYGDIPSDVAHYFWLRGALWGVVATTLFWVLLVPRLKRWWARRQTRRTLAEYRDGDDAVEYMAYSSDDARVPVAKARKRRD
jgi:hypothetical protein